MSQFDPDYYERFRPLYPASTFGKLLELLEKRDRPWKIADIGCGTGHSLLSLWKAGITGEFCGVDPDPGMLAKAREILKARGPVSAALSVGTGERTSLESGSQDAVIVGSAFHWMRASEAAREFARLLRPAGALCVFEYQFPKSPEFPALNDWIRRQFNLLWKAPDQTPRGTFAELTGVFADSGLFERISEERPEMRLLLSPAELTGLILSQSRTLHYLRALPSLSERACYEEALALEIQARMGSGASLFEFKLSASTYRVKVSGKSTPFANS